VGVLDIEVTGAGEFMGQLTQRLLLLRRADAGIGALDLKIQRDALVAHVTMPRVLSAGRGSRRACPGPCWRCLTAAILTGIRRSRCGAVQGRRAQRARSIQPIFWLITSVSFLPSAGRMTSLLM
jgi:hypothetical protein